MIYWVVIRGSQLFFFKDANTHIKGSVSVNDIKLILVVIKSDLKIFSIPACHESA